MESNTLLLLVLVAALVAIGLLLALLLRSRVAVWLFGLSVLAILVTNTHDFAAGTSRALLSRGAMIVTALIIIFAVLQYAYARAMAKRGVLR